MTMMKHRSNKAKLVGIALVALVASIAFVSMVHAQSGHFITSGTNAPKCFDVGTQVMCSGKVAGLGGTTFEILITAVGVASVECFNPAGKRAPGQDTAVTATGSTGPVPTPQNGNYDFNLSTASPGPLPATPTCPNNKWTPVITDVAFTEAILSLFEDGALSDQVTVPVQ